MQVFLKLNNEETTFHREFLRYTIVIVVQRGSFLEIESDLIWTLDNKSFMVFFFIETHI